MYNLNDIQSKFFTDKLLTFKSSLNSSTSVLDSDLTGGSRSNRYFNSGVHPLIKIENIEAFLPNLSDYTIAAYAAGTTYGNYNATFSLDDVVTSSSKYYISIVSPNIGQTITNTAYWKETTLLSLILKDKIRSSIETVFSNLITPNFIVDNIFMYRVADITNDVIENTSKLVGYRINPTQSNHLLFIINQIALDFEESETITFYLYNQNTQVSTFDLVSTGKRFEWKDLTQIEISSNTGAWYLFYDQSTLTGRAIGNNTIFYNNMFDYANITPFAVDSIADFSDFDSANLTYDRNYGINLNFSISYDLTDFIKQHMLQFTECFQRQFEYDIASMLYYNPYSQSELRQRNINSKELIMELKSYEGDTIIRRLSSSYKRLKATLNKLGYKDNAFTENEDDNFTIGSI